LLAPELVAAGLGDVVGVGVAVSVAVAVWVAVAVAVAVAVTVAVLVTAGVVVSVASGVAVLVRVGPPVAVALRLGRLLIALEIVLPQPAVRHPATRMTAIRQSPFVERHMSVLPVPVMVSRRGH
jgi:hypothetical protein